MLQACQLGEESPFLLAECLPLLRFLCQFPTHLEKPLGQSCKLMWAGSPSEQCGALQGIAGMPGALLHDSGGPAGPLFTSSGLLVWPRWLCVALGIWSVAGSVPAPSDSPAGACRALPHGPLFWVSFTLFPFCSSLIYLQVHWPFPLQSLVCY